MNYKQHISLGISLQISFILIMILWKDWFRLSNIQDFFQILILICVTPLLCDLDHKHGKLREGVTFFGMMLGLIGVVGYFFGIELIIIMIYGIIISSFSHLIFYITKHRGFTHSITFCLIISLGVYFLTNSYQFGLLSFVGCYSHLLGDNIFIKFI